MIKRIVFAAFLVFSSLHLQAQFAGGFVIGGSFGLQSPDEDAPMSSHFRIGGAARFSTRGRLFIESGINYSMGAQNFETDRGYLNADIETFEVPLSLGYNFVDGDDGTVGIKAGPLLSILSSAEYDENDISDSFEPLMAGGQAGLSILLQSGMWMEINYMMMLSGIGSWDEVPVPGEGAILYDQSISQLRLTIGLFLGSF